MGKTIAGLHDLIQRGLQFLLRTPQKFCVFGNVFVVFNMFGYVVKLYGGCVAFAAKRLKVIAHSSAEAEYAASSYASKEVMFVRNVCSELELGIHGPVCLAVDNEAAIKIAHNKGVTGRNKLAASSSD